MTLTGKYRPAVPARRPRDPIGNVRSGRPPPSGRRPPACPSITACRHPMSTSSRRFRTNGFARRERATGLWSMNGPSASSDAGGGTISKARSRRRGAAVRGRGMPMSEGALNIDARTGKYRVPRPSRLRRFVDGRHAMRRSIPPRRPLGRSTRKRRPAVNTAKIQRNSAGVRRTVWASCPPPSARRAGGSAGVPPRPIPAGRACRDNRTRARVPGCGRGWPAAGRRPRHFPARAAHSRASR